MVEQSLYLQFSDDGAHIRKWAREPFEGGLAFAQSNANSCRTANVGDELVEAIARAIYQDSPMRAISPALAELAGVGLNEVITWDRVLEIGGGHGGLLKFASSVVPFIRAAEAAAIERAGRNREQIIELMCAARHRDLPEQWPDGYTDGGARIERMKAEWMLEAAIRRLSGEG